MSGDDANDQPTALKNGGFTDRPLKRKISKVCFGKALRKRQKDPDSE